MLKAVLFSGGLDSTVLTYELIENWEDKEDSLMLVYFNTDEAGTLFEDVPRLEYAISERCKEKGIKFSTVDLKLSCSSTMETHMEGFDNDFVPFRNTRFIFDALAYLTIVGHKNIEIYIGAIESNNLEYSDQSVYFIGIINCLLVVQTDPEDFHINVVAPYAEGVSKGELLARTKNLGIPYELVHSCTHPIFDAERGCWIECGKCEKCKNITLLKKEAGIA